MSGKNTAVFGLYPDETELSGAIDQLKRAGFRAADLSMLLPENLGSKDIGHEKHTKAPECAIGTAALGAVAGGVAAWLIHSGIITVTLPFSQQLIAADPAVAVLAGAGALGILGAIVGAIAGFFRPEYEAKRYAGRIRGGGLLLSVHCDDDHWRRRAMETLKNTGAGGIGSSSESKPHFGASEKPSPRPVTASTLRPRSLLQTVPRTGQDELERHPLV